MPKIVDHHAYKRDLVKRAIPVFRRHGFHGIGMRGLAKELGIPKSSLYHYFPSKDELFKACASEVGTPTVIPTGDPVEDLVTLAKCMEEDFPGELRLLADYTGEHPPEIIRQDEALLAYNRAFKETVERLAIGLEARSVIIVIHGILLQRWLDGHRTDFQDLRSVLRGLLLQERGS